MISLFNWVICRFQPLIFRGCKAQPVSLIRTSSAYQTCHYLTQHTPFSTFIDHTSKRVEPRVTGCRFRDTQRGNPMTLELSTYHKSYMCHPLCLWFCTYIYIYVYYIFMYLLFIYIYICININISLLHETKKHAKTCQQKTHIKFMQKKEIITSQDS